MFAQTGLLQQAMSRLMEFSLPGSEHKVTVPGVVDMPSVFGPALTPETISEDESSAAPSLLHKRLSISASLKAPALGAPLRRSGSEPSCEVVGEFKKRSRDGVSMFLTPDKPPKAQKRGLNKSSRSSSPVPQAPATLKARAAHKSSSYRGVSKCAKDGRWQARIRVGSTVKYLGRFRTEEVAAKCYDAAFIALHGLESAIELGLNFEDSAKLFRNSHLGAKDSSAAGVASNGDDEDPIQIAKIAVLKIREAATSLGASNEGGDSSEQDDQESSIRLPKRGRPRRIKPSMIPDIIKRTSVESQSEEDEEDAEDEASSERETFTATPELIAKPVAAYHHEDVFAARALVFLSQHPLSNL